MAHFWASDEGSVIRFGSFQLDRTQGLRRGKEELRITPKSLCVLWELATRIKLRLCNANRRPDLRSHFDG